MTHCSCTGADINTGPRSGPAGLLLCLQDTLRGLLHLQVLLLLLLLFATWQPCLLQQSLSRLLAIN